MKVYISGKISGLPISEVEQKFSRAEWLLEDIGIQPVNPLKNGLSLHDPWKRHIARDIELLLECNGILMLTTWKDSKSASIEYSVAKIQGMTVLFESTVARQHVIVEKIKNAITEATGMTFEYYSTEKPVADVNGKCKYHYPREQDKCFARLMFAYHCDKNKIDFFRYFKKMHRTIMYHYRDKYENEMRYNPKFRETARQVEIILNQPCE